MRFPMDSNTLAEIHRDSASFPVEEAFIQASDDAWTDFIDGHLDQELIEALTDDPESFLPIVLHAIYRCSPSLQLARSQERASAHIQAVIDAHRDRLLEDLLP